MDARTGESFGRHELRRADLARQGAVRRQRPRESKVRQLNKRHEQHATIIQVYVFLYCANAGSTGMQEPPRTAVYALMTLY
jgi:hypothetical protein